MRLVQRIGRVAVVSTLTVGLSCIGQVGHADPVRTATTLGGFSVSMEAAPLKVLLDDPNATIPRPTGTAVLEGDPNYTLASVATGPNARGLASTIWPGNLFGEGLAQVAPGAPTYPFKAEAKYPDQPYTSNGQDGGQLSHATALGLDALGTASGAPSAVPGQVDVGSASSTSTATVSTKNVAVGTAVSEVQDVDLVGGIIHIGSVKTTLSVSSDGSHPASQGVTTVSGLSIAGQGYSVDDTGAHAMGQNSALPSLTGLDPLHALGISISGISQTASKSSDTATRAATGLVIRVDTAVLKAALAPVFGALQGPYATVISTFIPPAQQGNFYYLMNATPSITFVLGSANGSSAAVLPISFVFPPTSFPPLPGGLPGVATPPVASTGSGVAPDLSSGGSVGPPNAPPVVQPVLQAPGLAKAAAEYTGFGGIQPGWLLLALGLSGVIGWGLLRFLNVAAGLPLGLGCRLGAPTTLPDFRSVPA